MTTIAHPAILIALVEACDQRGGHLIPVSAIVETARRPFTAYENRWKSYCLKGLRRARLAEGCQDHGRWHLRPTAAGRGAYAALRGV